MKIGLITDCHTALKPAEDNKYYSHSFVKFQDSCAYFLRDHVDFVVNLGDVYHYSNDRAEAEAALSRMLFPRMMAKAPFINVIGNHDVSAFTKAEFLDFMRDPMKHMNRPMGNRRPPMPQIDVEPKDTGYYSFVRDGWKFIILDTNYDKDGNDYEKAINWRDCYINAPQIEWLRGELSFGMPSIIFAHANLDVREGVEYCSVVNAAEVREVLEAVGNVKLVLQGHAHDGGHSVVNGITYITLHATVLNKYYPDHCSCAVMELLDDKIQINGFEDQPSYTVSF